MKIIDLLNKIASEQKVPEKIKFNDYEYLYHDKEHGYCRNDYDCTYVCLDGEYYLFDILNDEVEILEEEKKIPEKLPKSVTDNAGSSKDMRLIAITLNQVIDYLKSKGE